MKKTSFALWLILVIYTIIYGFFFGFNSELLPELLQGQADGFSTFFFNWMGLVPIYFLLDAALDKDRPLVSWIPLGLSFALGAYATLWGYQHLSGMRLKLTIIKKTMLMLLLIGSGWLWIDAMIQTNPSVYFSQFFQDAAFTNMDLVNNDTNLLHQIGTGIFYIDSLICTMWQT